MEELFRRTVGPMIRIETRNGPDVWPSLCDPDQIESALLDLVINARDAIEDSGTILIETANVFASQGAHGDVPPGEYVVLSVTDTGMGMTPSVMAQALEPFFTTKPRGQGAGLGLSMVHGLLQLSGGHIRLHSEPGEGTRVSLYLPRYLGLLDEAQTGAFRTETRFASSVLVVDDEPAARMFVTDVLSDAGYTVLEAHDSRSGLRALESEARIDLLLTDVGLPGGMNGRQLADAARQRRPGLKVLFVTGYEENAAIDDNLLEEGVSVMLKPFGMAALRATVEGIIGR
jgi:CheY-like chemotaxis protein